MQLPWLTNTVDILCAMAKYEASGVLIGQVHPTMTKHLPGVLNNVPGSLPPKGGGRRGRKKGKEEGGSQAIMARKLFMAQISVFMV